MVLSYDFTDEIFFYFSNTAIAQTCSLIKRDPSAVSVEEHVKRSWPNS